MGLHRYLFDEKIVVFTCKEQLLELAEVFKRPKIKKYFQPALVSEFFDLLDDCAQLIELTTVSDLCRDPKDNYLLSLSVDSDADYLITGDSDLLELQQLHHTSIINFVEFERIMTSI